MNERQHSPPKPFAYGDMARSFAFRDRGYEVKSGFGLPDELDLLQGMNFFEDSIKSDIVHWAGSEIEEIDHLLNEDHTVAKYVALLRFVMNEPGVETLEALLAATDPKLEWIDDEEHPNRLRISIYLAHLGSLEHMGVVAGALAKIGMNTRAPRNLACLVRACGWAARIHDSSRWGATSAAKLTAYERQLASALTDVFFHPATEPAPGERDSNR